MGRSVIAILIRSRGLIAVALMIAATYSNQTIAAGLLEIAHDGWTSWRVPSVGYPVEERVFVQMRSGQPREIRVAGHWCNMSVRIDGEVKELGTVSVDESIDWLQKQIGSQSDLSSDALAAISRHAGERPLKILIDIVESDADIDLREDALFWMVMSESDEAFNYVDRLLSKK